MCLECDLSAGMGCIYPYCPHCAEVDGDYMPFNYGIDRDKNDMLVGECQGCKRRYEIVVRDIAK